MAETTTLEQPEDVEATPAEDVVGQPDQNVIKLTHEQLNAKLANNKRDLRRQLQEAQAKAKGFEQLKTKVDELLESGLIDGVEDLDEFRDSVSATLDQFKTEKERFEIEQANTAKQLKEAMQRAEIADGRYKTSMIDQAIQDEGAGRVDKPGDLRFVKMYLNQFAKADLDGKVWFEMEVEEDGKTLTRNLSTKEAMDVMEANPSEFGKLFKSTVNSGAGDETQVDGVFRTATGDIDFANMDFEKFNELMDKSPSTVAHAINGVPAR